MITAYRTPWMGLIAAAAIAMSGNAMAATHDFTGAGQTWSFDVNDIDPGLGTLTNPGDGSPGSLVYDVRDEFSFSLVSGLIAYVSLTVNSGAVGTLGSSGVAVFTTGPGGSSATYSLPSVSNTSGSDQTFSLIARGVLSNGSVNWDSPSTQPQLTDYAFTVTTAAVPEVQPAAMLFAGLGVLGAIMRRRRS